MGAVCNVELSLLRRKGVCVVEVKPVKMKSRVEVVVPNGKHGQI